MKKLYVFGNKYLDFDSFAGKVAMKLDDVQIITCTSPDDLLDSEEDITIIDVIKDITEPMIITDVSKIKVNHLMSLHDFDLGYFLNLMKELDMNKNIKIIGIPMNGVVEEISEKVKAWI